MSVLAGNSLSRAYEQTFSIEEASTQLSREKSKYIKIGNSILLKDSVGLSQQEYETQLLILDLRERDLAEIQKIATANKDLATLESVRTDRVKARIAALNSEQKLTKTIRSEQGKILEGSRGGRKALADAEKKKALVDKNAAFRTEEAAVLARQKMENAKPGQENAPKSMDSIRRIMAEEAVGLRTPEIQSSGLGVASGTLGGIDGVGGFRTQISPVVPNASSLPTTGRVSVPAQGGAMGTEESIKRLTASVQSLVDTMKSGTVVK
jgi:hypothetical protein